MKISKNIIISIALGIIACIIAVAFRLFSEADLWFQMFSAILGVIITIIITNLLLNSQSSQDIIRERSAEIFKEKLRIYQEFLQALYTILKEEAVTPDEIMKLQFQTAYIAMHTKSDLIKSVSEYVSEIVKMYAQCPDEKGKKVLQNPERLLKNLFGIVEVFKKELYSEKTELNPKDIDAAIGNFEYVCNYFFSSCNLPGHSSESSNSTAD